MNSYLRITVISTIMNNIHDEVYKKDTDYNLYVSLLCNLRNHVDKVALPISGAIKTLEESLEDV
jgi:hypothetical protein